eukprot:10826208-Ditylum_brightwellii.AAC.1
MNAETTIPPSTCSRHTLLMNQTRALLVSLAGKADYVQHHIRREPDVQQSDMHTTTNVATRSTSRTKKGCKEKGLDRN